jgi:hypothetical protein
MTDTPQRDDKQETPPHGDKLETQKKKGDDNAPTTRDPQSPQQSNPQVNSTPE